jgi:hypothetical protein
MRSVRMILLLSLSAYVVLAQREQIVHDGQQQSPASLGTPAGDNVPPNGPVLNLRISTTADRDMM